MPNIGLHQQSSTHAPESSAASSSPAVLAEAPSAPAQVPAASRGALLTPQLLAKRWGKSESWVYHRAQSGQLPVLAIGGNKRFRLEDIEAMERGESVPLGVRVVVPKK